MEILKETIQGDGFAHMSEEALAKLSNFPKDKVFYVPDSDNYTLYEVFIEFVEGNENFLNASLGWWLDGNPCFIDFIICLIIAYQQ